jgi:hypothetical protein
MSGGGMQGQQGAPMQGGGGKGGAGGPQAQGIGGPTTGQMHQQINNPQPQGGPHMWGGTPMPRPNMPGNPVNTMPAMTSGGLPGPMHMPDMRPAMTSGGLPQQPMSVTPMPNFEYGGGGGFARPNMPGGFPTAPSGGGGFRPQGVMGLFNRANFRGTK